MSGCGTARGKTIFQWRQHISCERGVLIDKKSGMAGSSNGCDKAGKYLWYSNVPPKVKHFVYQLYSNSLSTRGNLRRRMEEWICCPRFVALQRRLIDTCLWSAVHLWGLAKVGDWGEQEVVSCHFLAWLRRLLLLHEVFVDEFMRLGPSPSIVGGSLPPLVQPQWCLPLERYLKVNITNVGFLDEWCWCWVWWGWRNNAW